MPRTMTALLAMIACTLPMAAQTATDPSIPGPLPVSNTQYRFDAVQVPSIPYPVDIWATVWFPDGLPLGPYPLVILLHGNHGICRQPSTQLDMGSTLPPPQCPPGFDQTPNHLGYDYVASLLASYGYVVASINANAINTRPNGDPERGRLVQEHLRYWALWNSRAGAFPFDTMFSSKVDLQNVGLIGHSRGGEGVRAAYNFNRRDGAPFGIRVVMEIGPVDFGRTTSATAVTTGSPVFDVDNVAWTVFLSGCDGDVFDNQGMRVYDRARVIRESANPSPKSQIYIFGANHNFTNSEWVAEDQNFQCIDFPIITDRPRQQAMAKIYILGFFRAYMGREDFKYLFTNDRKPPAGVDTPVIASYTESPESILVIDDFSNRQSPDVNTAGGADTTTNLTIKTCSSQTCNTPPPAAWLQDPAVFAGRISWPQASKDTPLLSMQLASGGAPRDLSGYAILAFRVGEEFSTLNSLVQNQNFSIRLVDAKGATSNSVTAAAYGAISYPTGYNLRRVMLQTIRIPLGDFRGVDRKSVTAVQFVFDKTPTGALFMTDVHVTP